MALGEMNSGNESACELKRLSDTRNTATKPSDYYGKFVLTGIKHCTALGLPSSGSTGYGFYNVIGFDGWDDPLRKTYPLQLTGFHYKARTHSSYGNIDVLQQACPQEVWINPIDAQARGIRHGDTVRVFNNNGEMLIAAKVTPRILPGVTAIGQGAWLKADMFGDRVDHGGSINILTSHRPSPLAKGNPSHSNLVQIEKV